MTLETRADLLSVTGWEHLRTDWHGNPVVFRIHNQCNTCGFEWEDEHSAVEEEVCPSCDSDDVLTRADWIGPWMNEPPALWEDLPPASRFGP